MSNEMTTEQFDEMKKDLEGQIMKKHLIVIGIVIILLVVGLSGCNDFSSQTSEEDRFVGTWEGEKSRTITFFSDGEWIGIGEWLGGLNGNYEIKDGKLVMDYIIEETKYSLIYDYSFSNNDITLTLTTPENVSEVFTKQ